MSDANDHAKRLNMRRLRAGGDLLADQPVTGPGEVPSIGAFRRGLEAAVVAASAEDEVVMSFELDLRPLRLSQWSEPELPSSDDLMAAVSARCVELRDTLVFLPSTNRVIGFAPGLAGQGDADRLASALLVGFRRPFDVSGVLVHFEVRIGTAVLSRETSTAEALEAGASFAIGATRAETPFLTYSNRLKARRERDELLRADLENIVAEDELELVYQPILDVAEGRVIGVEAYVRWSHPEAGTLSPAEFLRLAEPSERIYAIGDHVLSTAFSTAAGWAEDGLLDGATVWVNITPTELLRAGFKQRVREIVASSDAISLGLDLAQGTVVREKIVCDVIRSLALDDVRAALDGFAGDLSLVDEVGRLPYDTVKLSQKLIAAIERDPDSRDAISLMTQLAGRHGLSVIATGVETAAQLDVVRSIGVRSIQGHLASHPVSAEQMRLRLLAEWSLPAAT